MKKLVISIFLLFLLVGCSLSNRSKIDAKHFTAINENHELLVLEPYNVDKEESNLREALVAQSSTSDFQIEFYDFITEEDAELNYKYIIENLPKSKTRTELTLNNAAEYKQTTEDKFYIVSKVDNTIIFALSTLDTKESMMEIVRELGYTK